MRRPSPAMTIAVAALVLASSGAAFAGGHYLITSKSQIKPSVIKQLRGAAGPAGPAGTFGASDVTIVMGNSVTLKPNQAGESVAQCTGAANAAISGGWMGTQTFQDTSVTNDAADGVSAWEVNMTNNSSVSETFQAEALCA